jgi:prepilin-type N-terminal cleavage/methylation domain-containing protein
MEKQAGQEQGFTLLEVMLALVLFGFLSIGISQNLIMTRGISETNIREVTAYAVASGYMEQMKAIPYSELMVSVDNPSEPVPTILNQGEPDPLMIDEWVQKTVVIDEPTGGAAVRTMPFHVRLEIDDLEPSGNGHALGITLFFAWVDTDSGRRQQRSLRTIISQVRTNT